MTSPRIKEDMLSLTLVGATHSYIVLLSYSNDFKIKCPIDGIVRQ